MPQKDPFYLPAAEAQQTDVLRARSSMERVAAGLVRTGHGEGQCMNGSILLMEHLATHAPDIPAVFSKGYIAAAGPSDPLYSCHVWVEVHGCMLDTGTRAKQLLLNSMGEPWRQPIVVPKPPIGARVSDKEVRAKLQGGALCSLGWQTWGTS